MPGDYVIDALEVAAGGGKLVLAQPLRDEYGGCLLRVGSRPAPLVSGSLPLSLPLSPPFPPLRLTSPFFCLALGREGGREEGGKQG